MFSKNSFILHERAVCRLKLHSCSDDYQYLQKSKLPTLHFQKGLFRLPIPELDKTCERYLNALKPILSQDQWEKTRTIVHSFQNGDGKELDSALKAKDASNKNTSYISKPWFDMYLKDRTPLPLNYNPAIVLNRSMHPECETQLCKATNMTVSSLRFMNSLKKNVLSPEVFHLNPKKSDTEFFNTCMRFLPSRLALYGAYMMKAYPLDMSQHPNLFCSTRIPQEHKDIIVSDGSGNHILVLRNGHFFKLRVLDDKGDILPAEDIYTCFKHIIDSDLKLNKNSIGVLTTENRDIWAKAREHLVSINPDNFQFIKAIDAALFVVCLDDVTVGENVDKIMRTYLHGDGLNRWFDKSFSLIISKDGLAAVNFEHSWGDGVAVLRYIKDVFTDVNSNPYTCSTTAASNVSPGNFIQKLEFTLDDKSLSDVRTAKEKFDKICGSLALNVVQQPDFGRKACNSVDLAPDAVMQLSFQVAYHKVYGNFVSTYESCSTSGFKHGRTETIRPCTEATKKFTLKFNGNSRPGRAELFSLFKECSELHKILTKDALMGQGFDRHLFGLKCMSEEKGNPLPDLYKDEAYQKINYNIISTSTLAAEAILVGGFGPVVPDGLGIGYSIRSDECGAIITSYPSNRNGEDFANALKSTLEEFYSIFRK
ncbi:hypothetical protein RUM44_002501 [Polyplax serrata]|uniref:Choline/carnitine acyltransferase domain-containing protein n=1 Tax=Polyplax serrata TaxID=468196 RepID=A0ABR1AEY6_POLSC